MQASDDGTPIANFTYDGSGRRAQKVAGGATHNYVYDGSDTLEDRIANGATTRNIHGPGIDQPFASVDGSGNPTYYLADHLGSIVQTTDPSATVTLTRQYDPYGNLLAGETTSGYAFTGREWDAETGLYYYRARYYDASTGRFLSEDSAGFRAGDSNLYRYAMDGPSRWRDPSGHFIVIAIPVIVVAAAAAVLTVYTAIKITTRSNRWSRKLSETSKTG